MFLTIVCGCWVGASEVMAFSLKVEDEYRSETYHNDLRTMDVRVAPPSRSVDEEMLRGLAPRSD
jgi:hypothetical protein